MTPELTVTTVAESGAIAPLPSLRQAREFARQSKAENTLRGYRTDWHDFYSWCESREFSPIPSSSEMVASYIAECAVHLKVGGIQRRLNAVAEAHKATGLDSPSAERSAAMPYTPCVRLQAGPAIRLLISLAFVHIPFRLQ
jgi:hypothetical protein